MLMNTVFSSSLLCHGFLGKRLFLVSDNDKVSKDRLERLAKGDFTQEELYQLEYTPLVLEEIKILAKNLLE